MFKTNRNRHDAANEAILATSRLFSRLWGEAKLADNGDVHFAGLPQALQGLTATQTWQRQLLGGSMSINLCLQRKISSSGQGSLRFCGGKFRLKGDSPMARDLIDHLHADASLMIELRRLDLAALIITLSGNQATIMLTPYGGGLAFLVMPPVRYAVAFPPDQIAMTARVVTRLERIVREQSRDRGSRMTH